ncbi:MAG: hypothetical protein HC869_20825 [Rhodospirillales bacterium]|nr:hypothetical protein [Rhodospirillales bacterium]
MDWTWKNRSVGRLYIKHTLLTADVMVSAQRLPESRPDIRLIDASTMLATAPDKTRRASNPFKLTARVNHAGKAVDLSVIPDAVFGLDFTAERKRKYFFLEADRATMPIARRDLNQTSYVRKLLAYLAGGGKANAFGAHFGVGNFRVLTVTTSAERMASMIAALKEVTGGIGSSQFLFVDQLALSACANLLSLAWTTGKGEIVTLSD